MASTLEYKGYDGSAEYSAEDEVFHGKLLGLRALVMFESNTASGLKRAFEEAVDDYLETCLRLGKTPDAMRLEQPPPLESRLPKGAHGSVRPQRTPHTLLLEGVDTESRSAERREKREDDT